MLARIFLCDCKYAVSRFIKHLKNTLCIIVLRMFIFDARASLLQLWCPTEAVDGGDDDAWGFPVSLTVLLPYYTLSSMSAS